MAVDCPSYLPTGASATWGRLVGRRRGSRANTGQKRFLGPGSAFRGPRKSGYTGRIYDTPGIEDDTPASGPGYRQSCCELKPDSTGRNGRTHLGKLGRQTEPDNSLTTHPGSYHGLEPSGLLRSHAVAGKGRLERHRNEPRVSIPVLTESLPWPCATVRPTDGITALPAALRAPVGSGALPSRSPASRNDQLPPDPRLAPDAGRLPGLGLFR